MKTIIAILLITFFTSEIMIFDFTKEAEINNWFITNDDVMGGLSSSKMELNSEGNGVFSGTVSTDNNGGFAMTRLSTSVELAKSSSRIKLRVKGDGKAYQLRLKSKRYQRYWYVQQFQTSRNWEIIELSLKDFYPSFRGYKLNKPNFDYQEIKELAILIGNKKDESFQLELDWIKVV